MIVVSDTTPLIGLSMLNQLELLRTLFNDIIIPRAVYRELTIEGAGRVGAKEVADGVAAGWIRVEEVAQSPTLLALQTDLDEGESEAIALALTNQAQLLLLDERKARAKAQKLGLKVTGTIGILLLARETGMQLDLEAELKQLRAQGFRISETLIKQITERN